MLGYTKLSYVNVRLGLAILLDYDRSCYIGLGYVTCVMLGYICQVRVV
jgi:hypothetical protein